MSKKKKIVSICFIISLLVLLSGIACLRPFALELSENGYVLEHCHGYFTSWGDDGRFYVNSLVSLKTTTSGYSEGIQEEIVEELIETLDLKTYNLLFKASNQPKIIEGVEGKTGFLLYEKDSAEALLLLTDEGELYIRGHHYTGRKESFARAFPEFLKQVTKADGKEQRKFLEFADEIKWE